jgi:hypothetical protein
METTTSAEQQSTDKWWIGEVTKTDHNSHVRVVTSSGFTIDLENPLGVLRALFTLTLRGADWQPGDGSRLYVTPDGEIKCIDTDKWVNPDFEFQQVISNAPALAYGLMKYLEQKL